MIITKEITIKKHSSLVKKMDALNIKCVNNFYTLPLKLFLLNFPNSNAVKIEYICEVCNNSNKLSIIDYTRKKHKDVCGICLKTKILIGEKSNGYGKSYVKGKPKTLEHKKNLCGPRPSMLGPLNPNWNPNNSEYKRYKGRVHRLSNKIYQEYKFIINPNNHPRTVCGIQGGWQLDHKISIKECFLKGYSVEKASDLSNLQLLPWKVNLLKSISSESNS